MENGKIGFPSLVKLFGDAGNFHNHQIHRSNYSFAKQQDVDFPISGNSINRKDILDALEYIYPSFLNFADQNILDGQFWITDSPEDKDLFFLTLTESLLSIIAYCLHNKSALANAKKYLALNRKYLKQTEQNFEKISFYKNIFKMANRTDKISNQILKLIKDYKREVEAIEEGLARQKEIDKNITIYFKRGLEDFSASKASSKLLKALERDLKNMMSQDDSIRNVIILYQSSLTQKASEELDSNLLDEYGVMKVIKKRRKRRVVT